MGSHMERIGERFGKLLISRKHQQNNRRNNIVIEFGGFVGTLSQWSIRTGIPYATLRKRIVDLGWDTYEALSIPVRKRGE